MKGVESMIEKDKREKRKRNLVFKGEKGDIRRELEKIGKEIGMKLEVEEIRKVRMWREEKAKMVIVKVKSGGSRRKILENNKKFKGREVWIEVNLTFKERKMKFKFRKIVEEEEGKGWEVRVGYRRMWIENIWWFWDEGKRSLEMERGGGDKRNGRKEWKRGKGGLGREERMWMDKRGGGEV